MRAARGTTSLRGPRAERCARGADVDGDGTPPVRSRCVTPKPLGENASLVGRTERFAAVSPGVGELDPGAFADLLDVDPDAALTLLADMTGATDVALRELARSLASRVVVDLARTQRVPRRGVGRLRVVRWNGGGDVDLDASLEAVMAARSGRHPVDARELLASDWQRPPTALCLLVDRSGSMTGERLATAAVAAAAVSFRHPDAAVVAFSDEGLKKAKEAFAKLFED